MHSSGLLCVIRSVFSQVLIDAGSRGDVLVTTESENVGGAAIRLSVGLSLSPTSRLLVVFCCVTRVDSQFNRASIVCFLFSFTCLLPPRTVIFLFFYYVNRNLHLCGRSKKT